jgi:hypothetical protein
MATAPNPLRLDLPRTLVVGLTGLLLAACASPSASDSTPMTVEEQLVSTTSSLDGDVTPPTEIPVITTVEPTATVPEPLPALAYPESWAQAVVDAANQVDFGQLDSYPFASAEQHDLFRAFVEFDLPTLELAEPCIDDPETLRCPISFDDTQTYWVRFSDDRDDERFAELLVEPQIQDTIAADGAHGSGCSPGPGPLPDGEWLGYIAERRTDEIAFDLICLVPNAHVDWEPVNESTDLRTVPVEGDVLVLDLSPADLVGTSTTYDNWGTEPCDVEACAVWISIRDGRVLYISEQFLS